MRPPLQVNGPVPRSTEIENGAIGVFTVLVWSVTGLTRQAMLLFRERLSMKLPTVWSPEEVLMAANWKRVVV